MSFTIKRQFALFLVIQSRDQYAGLGFICHQLGSHLVRVLVKGGHEGVDLLLVTICAGRWFAGCRFLGWCGLAVGRLGLGSRFSLGGLLGSGCSLGGRSGFSFGPRFFSGFLGGLFGGGSCFGSSYLDSAQVCSCLYRKCFSTLPGWAYHHKPGPAVQ